MRKKHVTFGGLGQHEFFLPTTGRGHENRRDRKNCEFYFENSNYCVKIRNTCVGPSTCRKYVTKKDSPQKQPKQKHLGATVVSPNMGDGIIVSIDHDTCIVEYSNNRKSRYKYPDAIKSGIIKVK